MAYDELCYFDTLVQFRDFVEALPMGFIVDDIVNEPLHPNIVALQPFPLKPSAITSDQTQTFGHRLNALTAGWNEITPTTPMGFSTGDFLGQIILIPTVGFTMERLTQSHRFIEGIYKGLEFNCYYIHDIDDIWLAQIQVTHIEKVPINDPSDKAYQLYYTPPVPLTSLTILGCYRSQVTTKIYPRAEWQQKIIQNLVEFEGRWTDLESADDIARQFQTLSGFISDRMIVRASPSWGGGTAATMARWRESNIPNVQTYLDRAKLNTSPFIISRAFTESLHSYIQPNFMYIIPLFSPRALNYPTGLQGRV